MYLKNNLRINLNMATKYYGMNLTDYILEDVNNENRFSNFGAVLGAERLTCFGNFAPSLTIVIASMR